MKAIMISIKPKWVAKILNDEKTIEIRKNKALANAIQKLIDENGYADIYVYCSKINKKHYHLIESITDTGETDYEIDYYIGSKGYLDWCFDGKVAFKFRCYKVEEIETCERHSPKLLNQSCLNANEFYDYLTKGRNFLGQVLGYAIHINDLEIFDKPKELREFTNCDKYPYTKYIGKAPQNFCYVEV